MTGFGIGNTMQDLTFYKLQQQTQQLIQQQNAYLAAQLQLARSQSISCHTYNQQPLPNKLPAQRSLSDISYNSNRIMDSNTRIPPPPPGLAPSPHQSPLLLPASLPQAAAVGLQRRDSAKSDSSLLSTTSDSASRYKTEKCRSFEETGRCRYGSKCQYAHGDTELRFLNRHPRYKTELCRTYHTTNVCPYGVRCNFVHKEEERRAARPAPVNRPSALQLHKPQVLSGSNGSSPASSLYGDFPFITNSSGSSPASSVYGGDVSPSHSPRYLDDAFTANTCSRLSPAPSLCSFSSDQSTRSLVSPSSTPPHPDDFSLDNELSTALDLSALLSSFTLRQ